MVSLARGESKMESYPPIKVAQHPDNRRWYSADNRRLFMARVAQPLVPLSEIEVEVVNWTSEFDGKVKQGVMMSKPVWDTDAASVEAVRQQVRRILETNKHFIVQCS